MYLTEMQKSALSEAANIGSGHAAIALSKLMNRKIMIAIPSVEVMAIDVLAGSMDKLSEYLLLNTGISGDIRGHISFFMKNDYARHLVSLMPVLKERGKEDVNAYELSVISEVGNIVLAAYLNSLSELAGLKFNITSPNIFRGNLSDISLSLKTSGKGMDEVICIKTEFMQLDAKIEAYIVFSPSKDSVDTLLYSLKA
ncbi:MAG: CheY-P phosphatase CheC [bacterium ADurb.Bin270]|nr:hypothetical protein [Myxococcales bacterium]OQA59045.1 MAG: CheY-P phosphatase CheC [bacterium ADurb.Bin270]HQH80382.1 chemotaxis protein CheC [bacterium]